MRFGISFSPLLRQIWTCSSVFMAYIAGGGAMGYIAVLIRQLQGETTMHVDIHIISWISSILGITSFPAYIIIPWVMNKKGRKIASFLGIVPLAIGWLVAYFATQASTFIIAGAFFGFGKGGIVTAGQTMLIEITEPKHRIFFSIMAATSDFGGTMVAHLLGWYIHWKVLSLILLSPLILSFIITLLWKESPSWLASQGRFEEATETFKWFRGCSDESEKELNSLIEAAKSKLTQFTDDEKQGVFDKANNVLIGIWRKRFIMPVALASALFGLYFSCGIVIVIIYGVSMVGEMSHDDNFTMLSILIIDLVCVFGSSSSVALVKIFKNKQVLISGGYMASLILSTISLVLFLENYEIIHKLLIPTIVLLILLVAVAGSTIYPIVTSMYIELLPLEHKELALCFLSFCSGASYTIVAKSTPYMFIYMTMPGTLLLYAVISLLLTILLHNFLPETSKKTLQEIENHFKNESNVVTSRL